MARFKAGILVHKLKQWARTKGILASPDCQKKKKGSSLSQGPRALFLYMTFSIFCILDFLEIFSRYSSYIWPY